MESFKKNIRGIEFHFQGFLEREEEVCVVRSQEQQFKMITDDGGDWYIWQQVPKWIKEMEAELGAAIDEAYG